MTMSKSMPHTVRNLYSEHALDAKQVIVIKIGGSVLGELSAEFYQELVKLIDQGWFPVIVHGGGPAINQMLAKLGITSSFINGLRVTDGVTLEVVQMVLNGKENKEIVKRIQMAGGNAIGLSGIDQHMIEVEPLDPQLGYVGKIKQISCHLFSQLQFQNTIPVISPLGMDQKGQIYNINADTVAQAIATQLNASKLLMVSDIPGIYQTVKGKRKVLHLLTREEIDHLITEQHVLGGMIPKVEAALQCLDHGIDEVYILDGREKGILTKVIDHQLVGTKIYKARGAVG
ncbi:acetylglutamate kinase [Tepidibacillus infernus]|nr:acetylglutamate kinase [Tepidibacillus decaturensis]